MRVLLTTQVFPPEAHPTAIMVEDLTRHLVRRGHDVTVAAGFPHHPAGRLLAGYRKRILLRERRDGFEVLRGWHATSANRSIPVRAGVMLSQAAGTCLAAHFAARRPDVILSYGPPLVGPLLTSTLAWRWRVPQVTVIYDIYPDVAIETGKVRNPAVIALARRAERAVYRASSRILVLSEGFRRTLSTRGVNPDKILVLPVWLDPDEIRPSSRENAWRASQGIAPSRFVVLYAGTVGIVSGAEVVLGAAARLRHDPDVLFLFVGDGQVKDRLEKETVRRGLANVRFLPLQPRAVLNDVQASADVSIVTLAAGRGRTSVPSKVAGYMAAGRPVVASVDDDSDTAAVVRSSACGVVVPPEQAEPLADAIAHLKADAHRRAELGRNARAAFEREHQAPAILDRYVATLEQVGGRRS